MLDELAKEDLEYVQNLTPALINRLQKFGPEATESTGEILSKLDTSNHKEDLRSIQEKTDDPDIESAVEIALENN